MNIKKELPNGNAPPGGSLQSSIELIVTLTVFEIEFPLSSVKIMSYI